MIAAVLTDLAMAAETSPPSLVMLTTLGKHAISVTFDGQPAGRVTRESALTLPASDGVHDVKFTLDHGQACSGFLEVDGPAALELRVRDLCGGLTPPEGSANGPTVMDGSTMLTIGWTVFGSDVGAVTIDGETLGDGGAGRYPLKPGRHSVSAYWLDGQCNGTVTLDNGEHAVVFVTPSGCSGLDPGARGAAR